MCFWYHIETVVNTQFKEKYFYWKWNIRFILENVPAREKKLGKKKCVRDSMVRAQHTHEKVCLVIVKLPMVTK